MIKRLLLVFLLGLSLIAFSQKQDKIVDSLMQVLKTAKEDTTKVNSLNALSRKFLQSGNYDKAMSYAKEALSLAEKTKFKKGKINSYNYIGTVFREHGEYAEALKNCLTALKMADEIGFKTGIADSYNSIGSIYYLQANYPEAIKNNLAALKIAKEINNKKLIANTYLSLGNAYSDNITESLKNYLAGLKIQEELGDKQGVAFGNINIGVLYIKMNKFPEAKQYLSRGLKLSQEVGNQRGIAYSYVNLGAVCVKLKNLEEAKEYYRKCLPIAREMSKNIVGKIYFGLSTIDSINGNYKGAYDYFRLYSQIKDSLLNEASDKQISKLRIQYETEKKDKEIEFNNIRIDRQKAAIRYILAGFILIIVFAIIYLYLYNQKRRSTFRQKLLETEMKALRSQMNPHFTFNVLNSIQYFISENDMESAELYIEKFASLIRMILDQSRTAYITLEQEINILKLYLELEEMRFEKKFKYSINIDVNIESGKLLIPGMLIQPIVENAIKHGIRYKEGDALIDISFVKNDFILLCSVTDNGIGIEEAKKISTDKAHKSTAMSIIKERMEALSLLYNIKLNYKTEDLFNENGTPEGMRVTIEIPIGIKEEVGAI